MDRPLIICLATFTFLTILTLSAWRMQYLSDIALLSYDQDDPVDPSPKWIVITSIHSPTLEVLHFANLSGWRVIVVGDEKNRDAAPIWRSECPACVFLDVETQSNLKYRITKHLPFRSYARKNIGYLYAIHHGATTIYESDDDNKFTADSIDTALGNATMVYLAPSDDAVKRRVVNPYASFGRPDVWPRGYPLSAISDSQTVAVEEHSSFTSWIRQGLANGDPDVDAVFRLTRSPQRGQRINIQFSSTAPPVGLPANTFAPFNSQNTKFEYNALWALLLPITTTFRVCDIWRSYIMQRLLWDVGGHIAFYPPSVFQVRNVHDYMEDYRDEAQIYNDIDRLLDFLLAWKSTAATLPERMTQLAQALADEGFWKQPDADLMRVWIEDLISVGYRFPPVRAYAPSSPVRPCDSC